MELDYIYSDAKKPNRIIVWDLGRRCNFDCTYCTAWMHSTTSPFNKLDKLKKTADFIDRYTKIYGKRERIPFQNTISFTGGEPAINPDFFPLVTYMQENYPNLRLNLTTNGTWSERRGQFLLDNMHSITVSYHCEGSEKYKELVKRNLVWAQKNVKSEWQLKVNVMMHMDYWDECIDLIENVLIPNNIRFIPRTIGDDGRYRAEWFKDMDGAMRRTSHIYTDEQMAWIKSYWNKKNEKVAKSPIKIKPNIQKTDTRSIPKNIMSMVTDSPAPMGHNKPPKPVIKINKNAEDGHVNKMGRMCCGGRCMTVKTSDTKEITDAMFIEQSNFKDYNCMINWFFLHIEEDRDAVYQHQTCMAKLDGTPNTNLDNSLFGDIIHKFNDKKGPFTTISQGDKYLDWLEAKFEAGETPTMVCPNTHCGCGICIAKAKYDHDFVEIKERFVE